MTCAEIMVKAKKDAALVINACAIVRASSIQGSSLGAETCASHA
eukprot:CAMPEP_0113325898 /NCGR_PEP_ID=MMETSP0010_2-20120614/18131_1 /TAXON_ID=216773 ORGANISM="Corethron hystrix, Strain 308" /NCGR_SAMPLE_ID=MMETSP0010_2 /ASSEMBLY_ACC=CAM_ASM_000155 /LENGTH=43 /DNA_ID=CAMNT_0000185989 /DNA_START=443 /DNA_END=574 /DNA_ORIENTATION=- /assembly_acc=CAM_ASM_000155